MILPKLIWRKIKLLPDEKFHDLGTYTTIIMQTKWPIPDDFGLRSPVVQKTFRTKISTSIVE